MDSPRETTPDSPEARLQAIREKHLIHRASGTATVISFDSVSESAKREVLLAELACGPNRRREAAAQLVSDIASVSGMEAAALRQTIEGLRAGILTRVEMAGNTGRVRQTLQQLRLRAMAALTMHLQSIHGDGAHASTYLQATTVRMSTQEMLPEDDAPGFTLLPGVSPYLVRECDVEKLYSVQDQVDDLIHALLHGIHRALQQRRGELPDHHALAGVAEAVSGKL